jgi:hypothetical protein
MKFLNNCIVSKKEVLSLNEVNFGFTKYKNLVTFNTNFFELFNENFLNENNLYELSRCITCDEKTVKLKILNFKGVDNVAIVTELSKLAELNSSFYLKGILKEETDDGFFGTTSTLEFSIENGQCSVVILK